MAKAGGLCELSSLSAIFIDAISKISRLRLASAAKQADLRPTWPHTQKTGFLLAWLIYILPLGWSIWGRPLCEDGSQWYRVRGHAADL